MELSPGDIFDAETDPVPENVTAELQRQSYSPRHCELVTISCDLVSPDPEQFYSLNNELDTARQSSSVSAQGEYDSEAQKVSVKTLS